jgi:ribonuclease E
VADREELKKQMLEANKSDENDIILPQKENESDVEVVHEAEENLRLRPHMLKKYKIQEVIHAGQVMLLQVVKEERGNKGAAMTTYISLAGRCSVLMPNNHHGSGISRKISNQKDRKALRAILDKLNVPEGMSVIIRTAGLGKTKTEIKRDVDYLMKTWNNIREITLKSIAPKLIHQEGDIIKRSLRDVFTPDIDEVLIDGNNVFKSTRDFVKLLMPTQVKKIKQYKGKKTLFQEYQVEAQLEAIHNNIVQLPSGGYLVIDQTEALVAVDVNSGRATREHNIEETALRTNLETCDELARQLRLRDMAGLIVIDFIDMDEAKNNAAVERRLKEVLRKDRARIQVGRMSGFGLIEMSRQRLHSSFLESSYHPCPCCHGKGVVRSVESCATHCIRFMEEVGARMGKTSLFLTVNPEVASYILNQKRSYLTAVEAQYGIEVCVQADASMVRLDDCKMETLRSDGVKVIVQPTPMPKFKIDPIVLPEQPKEEQNNQNHHKRHRHRGGHNNKGEEKFKVVESANLNEQNQAKKESAKIEKSDKKQPEPETKQPEAPKKGGWWNRLMG